MEVLLFALFFIVSLTFFVSGKDDFGRKEKRLIIKNKEKEEVKKVMRLEQKEDVKEDVKKEVEMESN